MIELIKKIDVCEPAVEQALKWLAESGNNGLNEASMNDIIRYLLNKTIPFENSAMRESGYYILLAYRYGQRGNHCYLVDLCKGIDNAKDVAEKESLKRGGKYSIVVFAKGQLGEFDEVYEVKCPYAERVNPKCEINFEISVRDEHIKSLEEALAEKEAEPKAE